MDIFIVLIVIMLGLFIYFLPGTIAVARNHKHTAAVVLTNLLFGWTFLGWAIALIWACMNQVNAAPVDERTPRSSAPREVPS
jgi:Superinfection immunity protein